MKNVISIIIVAVTVFSQQATAQVTQLELTSGFHKGGFSAFSIKPLNEKRTLSMSTLAFFQKFHRKEDVQFDEVGVKATAFWNFSKVVSVGPSLYTITALQGFQPTFHSLYSKADKNLLSLPSHLLFIQTKPIL